MHQGLQEIIIHVWWINLSQTRVYLTQTGDFQGSCRVNRSRCLPFHQYEIQPSILRHGLDLLSERMGHRGNI